MPADAPGLGIELAEGILIEDASHPMLSLNRLSVVGLGKLGACMAATLAQRGFEVVGIDSNPEVARRINPGEAPVYEPQLAETAAVAKSRLRATMDAKEAVETDASFVIVPLLAWRMGVFPMNF